MEAEVSTFLESISSKKSMILRPENQGDVKVILIKHYLPSSSEKGNNANATNSKADALSLKRKSFEMAGMKEKNEQCFSVKRRRSVPLTGSMIPSVALVQDLAQQNSRLDVERNINCMQQIGDSKIPSKEDYQRGVEVLHVPSTHINEGLDFLKDNQEQDGLINDLCDCNLLPNWLDNRNKERLVDSSTVITGGHNPLFSLYDPDLPQVENNVKCKSLFETYHINRVSKSIVDEV